MSVAYEKLHIAAGAGTDDKDEVPNLPLALCRFILKVALANEGEKGELPC
jgi:hypothetical protein